MPRSDQNYPILVPATHHEGHAIFSVGGAPHPAISSITETASHDTSDLRALTHWHPGIGSVCVTLGARCGHKILVRMRAQFGQRRLFTPEPRQKS